MNLKVFLFLGIIIFLFFGKLFSFSFEADEWNVTAHYLPLTKLSLMDGLGSSISSPILQDLSAGQHSIPIASIIYYLNTRFFGINYWPYAFMSLLSHSINSFLIFFLIKIYLHRENDRTRNIFGILGTIFFAFSSLPMHTITGASPFYGQNILSVTFFLLCLIFFRWAYLKKEKKFIIFSIFLLFGALLTKETSFFLFALLPFIAFVEKRIFSFKYLGKVFLIALLIYISFRFIPNTSTIRQSSSSQVKDTNTIVSRDISIYKNLPGEVILRTLTFPIRMTGTIFLSRRELDSIATAITPIVLPSRVIDPSVPLNGSEFFVVVYFIGLGIIFFSLRLISISIRRKNFERAKTLSIGLAIILLSSLPLVAIIFSFPRWGFDYYFDSRFYYNPNVGAAIVFPFLLFGLGRIISKSFRIKNVSIVILSIFVIWLINNMYVFRLTLNQSVDRFGSDRQEIIKQLKTYVHILPQKTIFYFETDGMSPFGPNLPFYTSIPQALAVAYYKESALPDSFFTKVPLEGKSQGYTFMDGRGLGYYTSKKDLSQALVDKKFELSDVHAFYYKSLEGKLLDNTLQVRKEMQDYINSTDMRDWRDFNDSLSGIKFLYPQSTTIEDLKPVDASIAKSLFLKDPRFSAEISFINVSPTFDIHDSIQLLNRRDGTSLTSQDVVEKSVYFDKYRFNKLTATNEDNPRYFLRFGNILVYTKTANSNAEGLKIIERVLGSLEITNEK